MTALPIAPTQPTQPTQPNPPAPPTLGSSIEIPPVTPAERVPAPPLPQGTLKAEPVPGAQAPPRTPLLRLLMPVIMIAAMAAMVVVMVSSAGQVSPMMLVFPLMMGMGFLMMFSPPEAGDLDETRRTYLRHLGQLRARALANADAQRAHEWHRHPDPADLWAWVGSDRLWERQASDTDALEVRIGTGTTALCTPVEVPDSGAPEDLDPVCAVSLRATVRAVGTVGAMPVAVALPAFRFVGLAGANAAGLARAMLAQLVFHHGPEAVAVACHPPDAPGWEWMKWLPHARDVDAAEYRILVVDQVVTTGTESLIDDPRWTTIIDIGTGIPTALRTRALEEGLALTVGKDLVVHTLGGDEVLGAPDALSQSQALALARRLAACHRSTGGAAVTSGDALDLLGVGDVDKLTAQGLWQTPPSPQRRLTVPFGVAQSFGAAPARAGSGPVVLDLKESAQGGVGPHGLCIGATGSGKSELLKALVVGLAITHSPAELNLVLVDFKGGATFLELGKLPHTSAVITNLEQEAILVERMHDAIAGEMNRRQEVLRRAGNFANVTDYNAACAQNPALTPLPALFLVIDEFSELLGQHPDFADLFVAVGRLGRSLHVHLLLASQRLDEGRLRGLETHLSYRIGLRTFSATESRQVLGVTDAHSLPMRPGVGYFKAGPGAVQGFQAAYVSGPLRRRVPAAGDREGKGQAPASRVIEFRSWEQAEEVVIDTYEDDSTTLLDVVVERATAAAAERGITAHQMWLPPLPAAIPLADIAESSGPLRCAIGIIDRPYHQRQDPLEVDFSTGGGHLAVVGGPRTGKTMALRSIVAALAATHAPGRVRIFVLDLGEQLATLDRLPHVAGVAGRHEEEKVRRVVDEVSTLIDDGGEPDGDVFVVLDGWHTLVADFEDLVDRVTRIAADGPAARVHLVVSSPRWTLLRPAIRDLITGRLELRLGDPMDSLVDRKAQQKLPQAPGRGLTADAEPMLIATSSNQDLAHITMTALADGHLPVAPLGMLPAALTLAELAQADGEGLAFALGGPRLATIAWDPNASTALLCAGSRGSGRSTAVSALLARIAALPRERARIVLFDYRRTHLGAVPADMLAAYAADPQAAAGVLADTLATLRSRLPGADVTAEQLRARSWWSGPDIFLVIDDLDLVDEALLRDLIAVLPHARDIGLRLILARKSGGIGRSLFHPFLAAVRDLNPAVLLFDADRDEGAVCGIKPRALPAGRAQWLADSGGGQPALVQVAQPSAPATAAHTEQEEQP